MSQTPDLLSLNRVDLTRIACDALASQGKKPSIGLVREWTMIQCGGKKGSDGDVQKDIAAWFDDLLKHKRDKDIDGLPDAVAALARDFWRLAVMNADQGMEVERSAMEQTIASAQAAQAAAERTTVQAQDALAASEQVHAQLQASLVAGEQQRAGMLEQLAAVRAMVLAKEERIASAEAELQRQTLSHAAAVAELDGLRRHSLQQIDQARSDMLEWKTSHQRAAVEHKTALEQEKKRSALLSEQLAGIREQLRSSERLADAHAQRLALMESELGKAQRTLANRNALPAATLDKGLSNRVRVRLQRKR